MQRHRGGRDKGAWGELPDDVALAWSGLGEPFNQLCEKYKLLKNTNNAHHLGTLGTGNHFIEVCLDESDAVWVMLHSGSRGVGNRIGTHFIELAQKEMQLVGWVGAWRKPSFGGFEMLGLSTQPTS